VCKKSTQYFFVSDTDENTCFRTESRTSFAKNGQSKPKKRGNAAVELLSLVALACLSAWSVFVWKERRELRKHNAVLIRELARAIAQRDPWYEEGHEWFSKAA
jgi:hypothetical protein